MSKKERNYWPLMIVGFLLFGFVMAAWTINETMKYPVEMDNSYMLGYHEVDKDINKILKNQQIFNKNYKLKLISKKIKTGTNKIEIELTDKSGNLIKDADIMVLATRPDTTKYDKKIKLTFNDNRYVGNVNLNLEGRWNYIVKAKVNNVTGFKTFKLSTLE